MMLEQSTNLHNGIVETSYRLSGVKLYVDYYHKPTGIIGNQVFEKLQEKVEPEGDDVLNTATATLT